MKTIKENLKTQAKEIRTIKTNVVDSMRNDRYSAGGYQYDLMNAQRKFRYEHIAYCMLRGREYSEIEQSTRPDNEIDMSEVESIMARMKRAIEARRAEREVENA